MDDVSRGQRAVPANVTVTVKKISAEAVKKSGSIRYTHQQWLYKICGYCDTFSHVFYIHYFNIDNYFIPLFSSKATL